MVSSTPLHSLMTLSTMKRNRRRKITRRNSIVITVNIVNTVSIVSIVNEVTTEMITEMNIGLEEVIIMVVEAVEAVNNTK